MRCGIIAGGASTRLMGHLERRRESIVVFVHWAVSSEELDERPLRELEQSCEVLGEKKGTGQLGRRSKVTGSDTPGLPLGL